MFLDSFCERTMWYHPTSLNISEIVIKPPSVTPTLHFSTKRKITNHYFILQNHSFRRPFFLRLTKYTQISKSGYILILTFKQVWGGFHSYPLNAQYFTSIYKAHRSCTLDLAGRPEASAVDAMLQ